MSLSSNSAWCQCQTPSKLHLKRGLTDKDYSARSPFPFLLQYNSYQALTSSNLCTACLNKTLSASTQTFAKAKHKIWPPALEVRPRQVCSRIWSVVYTVTGCRFNLFLHILCSSYFAVCRWMPLRLTKMFYEHSEYKDSTTDQQIHLGPSAT